MKLILLAPVAAYALIPKTVPWAEWKINYNRKYENAAEEVLRFKNFLANVDMVDTHNARFDQGLETYWMKVGKFGDWSQEEFQMRKFGRLDEETARMNEGKYIQSKDPLNENSWLYQKGSDPTPDPEDDPSLGPTVIKKWPCGEHFSGFDVEVDMPKSMDWRNASTTKTGRVGVLTLVKDDLENEKGNACVPNFSFGATCGMEGPMCAHGIVEDCTTWNGLSEQMILDCGSHNDGLGRYDNYGCAGGWAVNAMHWVWYNSGIASEDDYPYMPPEHACQSTTPLYATTVAEENVLCGTLNWDGHDRPLSLKRAIWLKGPVSAGVHALNWLHYEGGVYSDKNCKSTGINHSCQAMGWGWENGEMYWICKNHWGPDWGEDGYIRIAANKDMCGIEHDVAFANMDPEFVPQS